MDKNKMLLKDTLKNLICDIEALGLPTIVFQTFECLLYVHPDSFHETDMNYIFTQGNSIVAVLSKPEIVLEECKRPDNLIIDCKKCYRMLSEHGKVLNAFLYWKEVKKELEKE